MYVYIEYAKHPDVYGRNQTLGNESRKKRRSSPHHDPFVSLLWGTAKKEQRRNIKLGSSEGPVFHVPVHIEMAIVTSLWTGYCSSIRAMVHSSGPRVGFWVSVGCTRKVKGDSVYDNGRGCFLEKNMKERIRFAKESSSILLSLPRLVLQR